jgi:hypothetical protein
MKRSTTMPKILTPAADRPKLDLDALFALQKANLAALHEAQNVLVEATQAIVKAQADYARELAAQLKTVAAADAKAPRKPENVLAGVKAATEKAVAVGQRNVDLGVAAQRRVAELVAQRAQANLDELKALAA